MLSNNVPCYPMLSTWIFWPVFRMQKLFCSFIDFDIAEKLKFDVTCRCGYGKIDKMLRFFFLTNIYFDYTSITKTHGR